MQPRLLKAVGCAKLIYLFLYLLLNQMKKSVLTIIKEYAMITFGGVLNALSLFVFVNPCKLVAGGFTGLSSALTYIVHAMMPSVPYEQQMPVVYFILNVPLIVLSLIYLRGDFTFKTIWATVVCTLTLGIIPTDLQFTDSRLIAIIFGGFMLGLAMHVAAINNGSNGGTEIIAKLVNKYKPEMDISNVLLILNIIITVAGSIIVMVVEGENIWTVAYSLMYVWIGANSMGMFSRGMDHPQKYLIVTTKPQEMAQQVIRYFHRGVTIVDMEDNNGERDVNKMVMVVVQYRQTSTLRKIIANVDPSAFTFVKDIHDVFSRPSFNRSYKNESK